MNRSPQPLRPDSTQRSPGPALRLPHPGRTCRKQGETAQPLQLVRSPFRPFRTPVPKHTSRMSKLPETPGRSTGCWECPLTDSRVRLLNRRWSRESETPVWWFARESGVRVEENGSVPLGLPGKLGSRPGELVGKRIGPMATPRMDRTWIRLLVHVRSWTCGAAIGPQPVIQISLKRDKLNTYVRPG